MLNMLDKILKDFQKTIERLKEVLKLERTEIIRDSAIKRFELCFDLAWKTVKEFAREQGQECYSPRECLKTAFQLKLIEHDTKWLNMLKDRNLAVHLYQEEVADKIYKNLPEYLEMFKKLLKRSKENARA